MKYIEEQELIKNVYATARVELKHIQRCIEKIQTHLSGAENQKDPMYDEVREFMIELHQAKKELLKLMRKVTDRLNTEHFYHDGTEADVSVCDYDMYNRSQHIKYLIHKNKQAGIFAWELAKELVAVERQLSESIGREW